MKKYYNNSNAFTLVEIMFVVAIIAFLSVSWVNYFNGFVDSKRIETELYVISDKIELLNNKVRNKEIYDYSIIFSWSKDYLIYNLNQTVKDSNTNLFIDNNTKDFSIKPIWLTGSWVWEIKTYKEIKLLSKKVLDQWEIFTGSMADYQSYDIISTFESWEDLLWIMYYSEDNLNSSWITTNFLEANTKSDKSGLSTKNFVLKDINSKKIFYSWNTLWDNKEVYLFFEKAWVEKSIKISSN